MCDIRELVKRIDDFVVLIGKRGVYLIAVLFRFAACLQGYFSTLFDHRGPSVR